MSIEQGEIVGRADRERPGPGYLMSGQQFQDFRVCLEFWISIRGNSGIFVREPHPAWGITGDARPGLGPNSGYEINIDYMDPVNPTGSLYGFKRADKVGGGDEQWNSGAIECYGREIRVWIKRQTGPDLWWPSVPSGLDRVPDTRRAISVTCGQIPKHIENRLSKAAHRPSQQSCSGPGAPWLRQSTCEPRRFI